MTLKSSERHRDNGLIFAYPTADEIAARAYVLFVSGGRRLARLPEYWRKAEAELLEQAVERWRRENQPSASG